MTDRSVNNAGFTIEHTYDVSPAKVFAAFASAEAKRNWFGAGDPQGNGTRLTYTEQAAFLDGLDQPKDREHGTREMLTKELADHLKGKVGV